MSVRIGVDLGGTKIEAIILDEEGVERGRLRVPTPRDDYDATLAAIAGLVQQLERQVGGTATVGVGIPGTVEPSTGLVKNANSVWLIGQPLTRDLEARLARSVVVANDANCFALSEATDGAGAGYDAVFGVILGTGVGGGIAMGGRVRPGANGIAGEWGHNPLPWADGDDYPGPQCYCRKSGCIETYLSGPALAADHARRTGEALTAEAIVQQAQAGDEAAELTLARYEGRAARALGSIINVLDPDVIVLGGGVSNIDRLYTNIPLLWGEVVFNCDRTGDGLSPDLTSLRQGYGGPPELQRRRTVRPAYDQGGPAHGRLDVRTLLRRARHGDSSGVRGAAWLGAVQ
ncbi:MAG: ROK family protein [Vicinamibacterales bacterium]